MALPAYMWPCQISQGSWKFYMEAEGSKSKCSQQYKEETAWMIMTWTQKLSLLLHSICQSCHKPTQIQRHRRRHYLSMRGVRKNFQPCFQITAVLALTTNYLHSSRMQNTLSPLVRPPQSFIPLLHHAQAQGTEYYLLNQGHMQMRLFKFSALAIASLDLKTC